MNRRQLLAGGVSAALAVTAATAIPQAASAALPAATPQGDDVGFVAFAAVTEGVLSRYFDAALSLKGAWSPAERKLLKQAHDVHRANVDRANAALGPDDMITLEEFSRTVAVGSRAGALKVGRRLESLAADTYLGGVAATDDYGTRLLLGRLLAVATRNGALLARWAGAPLGGLPSPVDLDAAGLKIDAYLKDPS